MVRSVDVSCTTEMANDLMHAIQGSMRGEIVKSQSEGDRNACGDFQRLACDVMMEAFGDMEHYCLELETDIRQFQLKIIRGLH